MLTGPIFSQEDEEEMMLTLSEFRENPRVNESQEHSRGTVILEGEDEEVVQDAATAEEDAGKVFATPPNVVPQDYSRDEYEFSFDFSAPTHVYSLQFNPPEGEQNLHDDVDEESNRGSMAVIQAYLNKNQLFCWVSILVFLILCGVQQLMLVKNDLAALRLENEQLKMTVVALQQEKQWNDSKNNMDADDHHFYKIFEQAFPADATSKFNECATEAKNQLYHHFLDLKDTFWMTAEHVRDVIEDEILGPAAPEVHEANASKSSSIEQWFNKRGLKEAVDKTLKQIGGAKVVIPILLASGATMAVDWFWNRDD